MVNFGPSRKVLSPVSEKVRGHLKQEENQKIYTFRIPVHRVQSYDQNDLWQHADLLIFLYESSCHTKGIEMFDPKRK